MRTLILDSTFLPVRVVGWQRAMILFLTGRAEVIEEYERVKIRSSKESYNLPRILRLFSRHQLPRIVKFCRTNVFMRDGHICQYCGLRGNPNNLTLDHILPKARGGKYSWENIVTCCHTCNGRKGGRTPEEAGMKLLQGAKRPKWNHYNYLKIKKTDPCEWHRWIGEKKKLFSA